MRSLMISCLGLAVAAVSTVAQAASVNYGDKNAADLIYRQVTEDSITDPVPLFGNPTVSGNSLIFSPTLFGATASGAGGLDITDSTLNTTLEAKPGRSLNNVIINEAGDYSLIGTGTAAGTTATAAATYFLRIIEINNAPATVPIKTGNLTMSPSGGTYDIVNDPGTGVIWTGSVNIDVAAYLASLNISGVATKAILTLDNTLTATSQSGSISFIKKKTTDGVVIIVIPEPATLGAVGGAAVTLLRRRR